VRSEAEINAAVRDCLEGFQPGGSPAAHLASDLEQLHRDPSWTEAEIFKVEIGALRILTKPSGDDEE
jgi:hypothetical protein